ncbi:MAG: hypothetical protein JXR63_06315 [Spirochaetales bacterium]|nr:hypothetical protein [Spirochaetales bacterium]
MKDKIMYDFLNRITSGKEIARSQISVLHLIWGLFCSIGFLGSMIFNYLQMEKASMIFWLVILIILLVNSVIIDIFYLTREKSYDILTNYKIKLLRSLYVILPIICVFIYLNKLDEVTSLVLINYARAAIYLSLGNRNENKIFFILAFFWVISAILTSIFNEHAMLINLVSYFFLDFIFSFTFYKKKAE